MRRLILMRHAKSDWSYAGLSDHDRPLNKRGRASAQRLGEWLREKGFVPDQVLSSSSQRTGETFLGLAIDPSPETAFLRELYLAAAADMLRELRAATGQTVLMLGHNPGICDFAHRLANQRPSHIRFEDYPTGATTVFEFDIGDWTEVNWQRGNCVEFVIPREL